MLDTHIHTKFSHDGRNTMEEIIQFSIKNNVKVLGISEHLDLECPLYNYNMRPLNISAYRTGFCNLNQKYGNDIKLLFGIELGYDPKVDDEYRKVLEQFPFDFVINSVHLTDGKECYFLEYFNGKSQKIAYERYLHRVYESLSATFDYQIVGHLGYVARQAPFKDNTLLYEHYPRLFDKILAEIIRLDKALEVNTSTKNSGSNCIPDLSVLKKYYELGGRKIVFGSDAHDDFRVCDKYSQTTQSLRDIGFTHYCYYENKKAYYYEF